MSFILDALRKSDRRRRMNEAPDLAASTIEPAGSEASQRRRLPGIVMMAVLLLIAALVLAAYLQRDRIERQWTAWVGSTESPPPADVVPLANESDRVDDDPAATAYRERLETPRERVVSDPVAARQEIDRLVAAQAGGESATSQDGADEDDNSSGTAEPRRGQSVSRPAPRRNRPSPASAEQVAAIQRQLDEAQRRREIAAAGGDADDREQSPDDAPASTDADDESTWSPEAAEYVRAWELPLSIRRSLPALTLNIHVFSEQLDERFVLINGERYIGGDELPDGARLVDIRREGAVVDYRDYRFLLEP